MMLNENLSESESAIWYCLTSMFRMLNEKVCLRNRPAGHMDHTRILMMMMMMMMMMVMSIQYDDDDAIIIPELRCGPVAAPWGW
jgi:hypothetical protein